MFMNKRRFAIKTLILKLSRACNFINQFRKKRFAF